MNPISYDGIPLIIIDGTIGLKSTAIIAKGYGSYDGSLFSIEQENGHSFILTELDSLTAIPLTGLWKEKYPDYQFYIQLKEDNHNHKVN